MIKNKPFTFYIFVAMVVAFCALIVVAFTGQQQTIQSLTGALARDAVIIDRLATDSNQKDAQIRALGEVPDAPPASTVIEDPPKNGENGRDGRNATDEQVQDAIAEYCAVREGCRGAPAPVVQGPPGETVVGADGKDGSDGMDGTNGLNGNDGPPGRGVSAVSCVLLEDLSTVFRFTFTDSTTQDVAGSCLPAPAARR